MYPGVYCCIYLPVRIEMKSCQTVIKKFTRELVMRIFVSPTKIIAVVDKVR
jgi:hypothetical protein